MLEEIGNDLKKILLAGVGAVAVTAEKSEEIIRELIKKGELTVEQGRALNEEYKQKARQAAAERKNVDVERMSREEREALRRRLEELDRADREQETAREPQPDDFPKDCPRDAGESKEPDDERRDG